jgi:hypothetical protein
MTIVRGQIRPEDTDHELLWSIVGLCTFACGVFAISQLGLLPIGCIFKAVTGLPCPTCGAGRACLALLQGEVGIAIRSNPLVTLGVFAWAGYIPYGLLASFGVVSRVRVTFSREDRARLRVGLAAVVAVSWLFLIADGR